MNSIYTIYAILIFTAERRLRDVYDYNRQILTARHLNMQISNREFNATERDILECVLFRLTR